MTRDASSRRPHETHWAWRSRLVAAAQAERDRSVPLVTPEAERHGQYDDETVMHVETGTRVQTKRNRHVSSLVRLHHNNQLTNDQFVASQRIIRIAERIERNVSLRCASLEARVDNSRSSSQILLERLNQVRDEVAYTRWRGQLRLPRRLVLDMLLLPVPLAETARRYRFAWTTARRRLVDSLDLFIEIRERVAREVDESDMVRAQSRIAA